MHSSLKCVVCGLESVFYDCVTGVGMCKAVISGVKIRFVQIFVHFILFKSSRLTDRREYL